MKLSTISPAIMGVSILFSFSTQAALVGYDINDSPSSFEIVYDTVLDISWLADANLAASNTFGVSRINPAGDMSWYKAEEFIGAINTAGYLGVTTWRQASASGTCWATIVCGNTAADTDDELNYHYYQNFGATDYGGMTNGSNTANLGLFTNIQNAAYWTGTEMDSSRAFLFRTNLGRHNHYLKLNDFGLYVWPVADGNVAANAVPVPAAAWLFASGVLGLIGFRRFK